MGLLDKYCSLGTPSECLNMHFQMQVQSQEDNLEMGNRSPIDGTGLLSAFVLLLIFPQNWPVHQWNLGILHI